MTWDKTTNVLIVGAGPVGMMTALALADQGVTSMIIDAGKRATQHSFACALHARSLEILEGYDLWDDIVEWGRRVESMAFYDGARRMAELDLVSVRTRHPFVVVLPQNGLQWMMEQTLRDWGLINVLREHQLTDLRQDENGVFATVSKMTPSSMASPQSPAAEQHSFRIKAQAVVGADGRNSAVRRLLGIPYESYGGQEHFMAFEYNTDAFLDREIRVVLDSSSTNVLWPISRQRCRWTLQFEPSILDSLTADGHDWERLGKTLESHVLERAPWFEPRVKNVHWISHARFERRLAQQFALGRCRLVGDAAHQTGPVGVQSMNAGLAEAVELSKEVVEMVAGGPNSVETQTWSERCRRRWLGHFAAGGATARADPLGSWLDQRAERLIPCLPAMAEELPLFLDQIRPST